MEGIEPLPLLVFHARNQELHEDVVIILLISLELINRHISDFASDSISPMAPFFKL